MELDWIGLDWIGLDWVGADWIGLDFGVVSLDVVRFWVWCWFWFDTEFLFLRLCDLILMVRYVECSWLADQILLKDFFGVGLVGLAGIWVDVKFAFLFGKGLKQHHGPKIWGGNPLGPRIRTTSWPQALWREPVGNPHTAEASVAVAGVVVFWGFETGPSDQRISAFGPATSSRIDFWSCGHHSDKSVGRCQLAETDPRLLRCKRMLMRRHEARPPQLLIFVLCRATPLPPARPLTPASSGRVESHGFLLKKLLTPESSGRVESHGFLLKKPLTPASSGRVESHGFLLKKPLTPASSGRVESHGFLLKKPLTPASSGRVESHGFLLKKLLTPASSGRVESHGFLLKKLLTPASSGRVESHGFLLHGFLLKNNCIFLKQDRSRPAIGQCHSKLWFRTDSANVQQHQNLRFASVLNEFYVFLLRSRGGVMRSRKAEIWTFTRGQRCPCSTVVHLGWLRKLWDLLVRAPEASQIWTRPIIRSKREPAGNPHKDNVMNPKFLEGTGWEPA